MALRFLEGCQATDYATKYSTISGGPVRGVSTPPVSGGAYYTMSSDTLTRTIPAASEVFGHVRFRHVSGAITLVMYLWGDGGTTQHLTFRVVGTNLLEVRRGTTGGTLLATGATVITNGWHILEFRATIADAGGVFQARLDGSVSNEINFSGDTKNAGTATTIDAFTLIEGGTAWDFTDLAICDTTGSVNNTWFGETTVRTLSPNGNGNSSQLVGSDADSTDNYLLVDELPVNTSDYVGSATVSQGDTYTLTDLVGTPTVYGIQVNCHAGKSDAGAISAKVRIRTGSTDYTSSTLTPAATGYGTISNIWEINPNTSTAWTSTTINSLEAGIEVA